MEDKTGECWGRTHKIDTGSPFSHRQICFSGKVVKMTDEAWHDLGETRVGVVENGMLQEVHVERASKRGYVGNVYKGRVQRVMPGMQAVFVEIGLERAAFLHASDIVRPASPLPADGVEPVTSFKVTFRLEKCSVFDHVPIVCSLTSLSSGRASTCCRP